MDTSFESRVWQKALDRGLLSTRQVNDCLKESNSTAVTLRLTEVLIAKGYLQQDQVRALRGELTLAEPEAPEEVRAAARDPRRLIGRFVNVEELGRGGMGVVYRAWDGDLRRFIALKVLSGPWDEEDLARFRREAQSAAALRHPNIIGVYEISPSDETPYIALELIDGKTLAGKKLPSRKAAEMTILIARAVEAAHRRGIIHRDLKPHNIMVDAEGRPRVMDFGLAKPVLSSSKITMTGTVMGTPAYMSPEQARGRERDVDQRTDIFSLGAMLYELLTGRAPFRGSTPLETLKAVVEEHPVRPRKLAPSIPKPLEAIILTCLQKDKTLRYASAEALARDLERFLKGEAVSARMPRSPGRLAFLLSGGIAFAAALAVLIWPSAPPPAPLPPAPPPQARPKVVDRTALDDGLRLLEEARLDQYRTNAEFSRTIESLRTAELRFEEALRLNPNWGEALLARGQVRRRLNRLDEALEDFSAAIQRLPNSPAAFLARGRLHLDAYLEEVILAGWKEQGLPEELLQRRRQATEDFLQARRLGASEGDLPFLEACLTLTEDQLDRVPERVAQGLPSAVRPEEFYALRGNAQLLQVRSTKDYAKQVQLLNRAVDDFNQALRLRVHFVEVWRMRGAALFFLNRAQEALSDFQNVLRMYPDDSRSLSDIATFYQRSGQKDKALDYLDRAIAADARNFRALANRASLHLEQRRLPEARRDAEQALKVNPYHIPAHMNLASAHVLAGEHGDAIRHYNEILSRVPRFTQARSSRALVYTQLGRWKEALADFEQVAAESPAEAERCRAYIQACRAQIGR